MASQVRTINFFYHSDNKRAVFWKQKIEKLLKRKYSAIKIIGNKPQALIVLGGDGTILEAAQKYQKQNPVILGLNLGHVGFLASAREPRQFLPTLDKFFNGKYWIIKRMMFSTTVFRKNKPIFTTNSLNEIVVKNPLNMVEIEVSIEGHLVQYVRGTGILVSTATGSTAYNLSAHGPIVMPDIKCFILTELLDHNIPTPSMVVKRNREITLKVMDFKKRGQLTLTETNKKIDVVLVSDGETIFPLQPKDVVIVHRSPNLVKFAEFEKNYFFKSLQEKFAFK